jgi:hypothetical protein
MAANLLENAPVFGAGFYQNKTVRLFNLLKPSGNFTYHQV